MMMKKMTNALFTISLILGFSLGFDSASLTASSPCGPEYQEAGARVDYVAVYDKRGRYKGRQQVIVCNVADPMEGIFCCVPLVNN